MTVLVRSLATAVMITAAVAMAPMANAHQTGMQGHSPGKNMMMRDGMMGGMMRQQGGGMGARMPMMDRAMMQMMRMHHGAMMMGRGGMGRRMMHSGRRMHGEMQVRQIQHLEVDDAKHFFEHYLERMDNKRLKLGKVEQTDDDTIIAEIVTVDGSLVHKFQVDRHSGRVSPAK